MLTVKPTSRFRKELKLAVKRGLDVEKLKRIVKILAEEKELPVENRDHGLSGNFKGYRECHIESDWLLIYKISRDVLVLSLERTGTHSDLFKK
jgi:mRNA interferase YafQ